MLDLWKDYAKEMGFKILAVDALLLVSTLLVAHYVEERMSVGDEVLYFTMATFAYVSLFVVHSFYSPRGVGK